MLATAAVPLLMCSTTTRRGTAAPGLHPCSSGAGQPTVVTLRGRKPGAVNYASPTSGNSW